MMHTHYCTQINLKFDEKGDIYSLKVLGHKILCNYLQRKKFAVEKAGRNHVSQRPKQTALAVRQSNQSSYDR